MSHRVAAVLPSALFIFVLGCRSNRQPAAGSPVVPVTVVNLQPTDVPLGRDWVGTVDERAGLSLEMLHHLRRSADQSTNRAIRVAARFSNPNFLLRPGEYTKISADVRVAHDAILIPQDAIQDLQGTDQVYVVGANNRAHIVNVSLGEQSGHSWIVTAGLKSGTQLIVDNLQELSEGASVIPKEQAASRSGSPGLDAVKQ